MIGTQMKINFNGYDFSVLIYSFYVQIQSTTYVGLELCARTHITDHPCFPLSDAKPRVRYIFCIKNAFEKVALKHILANDWTQ